MQADDDFYFDVNNIVFPQAVIQSLILLTSMHRPWFIIAFHRTFFFDVCFVDVDSFDLRKNFNDQLIWYFFRRSSIGTFIRSHPSSESSTSSQSSKPKKEAPPKLDYRSMVSIDDMPALFVSFDSKFNIEIFHELFLRLCLRSVWRGKFVRRKVFSGMLLIIFFRSAITFPCRDLFSPPETFALLLSNRNKRRKQQEMKFVGKKKFSSFSLFLWFEC